MSSNNPFGGFDFEQLRKMLEQLGFGDAENLNLEDLVTQVSKMQGGAMFGMTNADRDPDAAWRTTLTAAKQLAAESGADPALTPEERAAVIDAERLAQSWLSAATAFPESGRPARAVTRGAWLDETGDGWRRTIEPIIEGLADALERGTAAEQDDRPELQSMTQMFAPMLRQSASMIYRDRLKRELAQVAGDILTGTELGVNLLNSSDVVLLPANVAQFTRDLDTSDSDVVLFLLLREAARQRLFHAVAWLTPQLGAMLAHFAREITIDFDAIAEQFSPESLSGLSIEDVVAVGESVRGSFFRPTRTPTQVEILERLQVLLALVEGWVDHVVAQATAQWMPNAPQLEEIVHRRRASGTAVTSVFTELLGLDLHPRLVRDAKNLWAALLHHRGAEGRDAVWGHPDMLPTAAQLADPLPFAAGQLAAADAPEDDLDAELRKLLGG
ncbi:MAG: zinc-dependent metalloprotease [Tessaracoccus sp.]|uniref:zinc-dependent metalloprotease n=1 Tax=Tessaracoccus sp. TaxID=1971211 RepID=UPI001ECF7D31|nr:zinc-dependent metalloprotease [Tessaracoccus sp.]MBK7821351.1 zinc-dependent metalloprotease [Tessaracoccus sp.]